MDRTRHLVGAGNSGTDDSPDTTLPPGALYTHADHGPWATDETPPVIKSRVVPLWLPTAAPDGPVATVRVMVNGWSVSEEIRVHVEFSSDLGPQTLQLLTVSSFDGEPITGVDGEYVARWLSEGDSDRMSASLDKDEAIRWLETWERWEIE